MNLRSDSALERLSSAGSEPVRAAALIELGRYDDAELELAGLGGGPEARALSARLLAARGEFLPALRELEELGQTAAPLTASVLALLGRVDEALALLAGDEHGWLERAEVHLRAGETAQAAVALSARLAAPPETPAEAALRAVRVPLAEGEIAIGEGRCGEALVLLRRAFALARRTGSQTLAARSLAALGEAHADCRNRWRGLRSVTRALDLASSGRVHAGERPAVHYRAFVVYGMFGHRDLAEAALETGHHLVVQLASGIDEREYRETFFIDNRESQRLVAAWKGDVEWGSEVRE